MQVKAANPVATLGEVAKILGAQWQEMDEEHRAPYAALHKADQRRYEAEVAALDEQADPSSAGPCVRPTLRKLCAQSMR